MNRYFERANQGDVKGQVELLSPDFVEVTPLGAVPRSEWPAMMKGLKAALPDMTFAGTHTGDMVTPQGLSLAATLGSTSPSLTTSKWSTARSLSWRGCSNVRRSRPMGVGSG